MRNLIDIGANLCDRSFAQDLHTVLAAAAENGVSQIIVTGTSELGSHEAADLAEQHPGLFSTAGVHPHDAKQYAVGPDDTPLTLKNIAAQPHVVAIGETGLDFNRDFSPRDLQEKAFASQIEIAKALALPLFLHERDAFERFAGIVSEHDYTNGVVHCFTGSEAALKHYLDLGFYIGITGWICDERRGTELQRLVRYIPDDRLLIETDAPYLLPRTIRPRPKSRRNEPKYLPMVVDTLAACREQTPSEIAAMSAANAKRLFSKMNVAETLAGTDSLSA